MGSETMASHKASPSTRISNWGGGRNSSIELLRIVAMFMILAHHFVVHNGYDVKNLSLGPERIFFQLVMQGDGKVGRRHLLHHLRVVLPRQGTDHQIEPQTHMDSGTRGAVLEPCSHGILSGFRPC